MPKAPAADPAAIKALTRLLERGSKPKRAGAVKAKSWAELVDALVARGLAVSFIDDRDGEPRVEPRQQVARVVALAKLPDEAGAWFDGRKHDTYSTWAIQRQLGKALSAYGVAVLQLAVRDPDRFVMAVVPWNHLAAARALAKTAGGRIIPRCPTKPIAKPRAAAKPLSKALRRQHVRGIHHRWVRGNADGVVVQMPGGLEQVAVTAWPPKRARVVDFHGYMLAYARDGEPVVYGTRDSLQTPMAQRPRTLVRGDRALPPPPGDIDVARLGVLDDEVVVFPSASAYVGKRATRPLVLRGKSWVALDVPPIKAPRPRPGGPPAFAVQGFARTADDDVLIWQGRGYVRRGKKLVPRFDLGQPSPYDELESVPDGDGFFVVVEGKIVEARPGAKSRVRLPNIAPFTGLAVAPDGAVLARVTRLTPKHPLFVAWWPARREFARVPATLYAMRGRDDFDEHGVSPRSGYAWGYRAIRGDLRAIAWGTIAALERTPE